MTRAKIIDRVRKFSALAGSSNPHEAASARKRANALKRKYKIKAAEIATAPNEQTRVDAEALGSDPYWRMQISYAVGGRHRCRTLLSMSQIAYAGREAARAAAQHRGISAEINRYCFKVHRTQSQIMMDPQHGEALVEADMLEEAGDALATRRAMNRIARDEKLAILADARARVWITAFRVEAVRAVAKRLCPPPPALPLSRADAVLKIMNAMRGLDAEVTTKPAPMSKEDSEQLARAKAEVEALERVLLFFMGAVAARQEVETLLGKAAALGTACGNLIYLGEAGLLGESSGKVEGCTLVAAPVFFDDEDEYEYDEIFDEDVDDEEEDEP